MIYGSDTRDMEEIYVDAYYEQASLVKLEIPKNKIKEMKISLCKMDITDSAIYPDLQDLATEMRRTFGYWGLVIMEIYPIESRRLFD